MASLVRVCIVALAGWTGLVYAMAGLWHGSVLSAGLGLIWLLGREVGSDSGAQAGLVAFTTLAVAGLFWDLPAWTMLVVVVGGLVTWDLQLFTARLTRARYVRSREVLVRAHVSRLATVATLSIVLGGLGLNLAIRLSLMVALGLGSLATLILTCLLRSGKGKEIV